jgi:hypothetical protein
LLDAASRAETTNEEREAEITGLIVEARNAGAPYLAVAGAYLASAYRLIAGDPSMAESQARWAAEVADSRGWSVIASKARALVPAIQFPAPSRSRRIRQPDGTGTVVAPRRPQRPAATDVEPPLPDPFDE